MGSFFNFWILILLIHTALTGLLPGTSYSWTASKAGDWSVTTNWTPNGIPGSGDSVTLSSGDTATVSSDVTITSLTMSGTSQIAGSAKLTITGSVSWSRGEMAGSGTTEFDSGCTITISGSSEKHLTTRVLDNYGTITWTGTGKIMLNDRSHIKNRSGATFDIQNDVILDYVQETNGGHFTNYGTLTKSAGDGIDQTEVDPLFINYGTVNAHAGILRFERGDSTTSSSGTFNVTSGNTLVMAERPFTFDNASFTGSGTVKFLERMTIFSTGSGMSFSSATNLQLDTDKSAFKDGFIGGDGSITVNGPFQWIRGDIRGSGAMSLNGAISFSGSNNVTVYQRTVTLNNDLTWTGTAHIRVDSSATVVNAIGSTMDLQVNARIEAVSAGSGTFQNIGALIKNTATGTSIFSAVIASSGSIEINAGTFTVQANGDFSNSTISVAAGCGFHWDTGTHTLDNSTLSGSGNFEISTNAVNIEGAGATADSAITLTLTTGVLGGSGTLTLNGSLNWTDGDLKGSGIINVNGSLSLISTALKDIYAKTINVYGTMTWSGDREIFMHDSSLLAVQSGGTFDIQVDNLIDFRIPLGGSMTNAGTLIKSTGSGTTTLDVNLNNSGTINLQTGTLEFTRTLTNSATPTLLGSGTLVLSGATYSNSGTISPGSSTGKLDITGNYTQTSSASMGIEIGGLTAGTEHDQLAVSGLATLDGTLNVSLINGFAPQAEQTFDIVTFGSRSGTFSTFNSPEEEESPIFSVSYSSTKVTLTALFDVTLPVELAAFTARGAFRTIDLKWTTYSEINNLGYEIYRSEAPDGPYVQIASYQEDNTLAGAGNSNVQLHYSYQDGALDHGKTYWYKLADVDIRGIRELHGPVSAQTLPEAALGGSFQLLQNYPNPFNPETHIPFFLQNGSTVNLTVYDVLGREIRQLVKGFYPAGEHRLTWDGVSNDGRSLPSGFYLVSLTVMDPDKQRILYIERRKMTLVR